MQTLKVGAEIAFDRSPRLRMNGKTRPLSLTNQILFVLIFKVSVHTGLLHSLIMVPSEKLLA